MQVKELDKQISSNKIKSVYLFYGDEQFLLEDKIKSIQKRLVSPDFKEFNYAKFEGKDIELNQVLDSIRSVPMMSDRKLVLLKDTGFLSNIKSKEYTSIIKNIDDAKDYICIIFIESDFDKKKEKNYKFIEDNGAIVNFEKLPVNQVEIWLERLFEKSGKRISPKETTYMVRLCGQSLGNVYSEFSKLINYMGEREKVTREDLDRVVTKSLEFRIYDIFDDIVENKRTKVINELKSLMESKEKPTMILGMIASKFSELLTVKQLADDGMIVQEMGDYFDFKRPPFVMNKMMSQSKRFGEAYLKRMIFLGMKYDIGIKTGKVDGWMAVQLYICELIK